jgi:SAM-dependent methyltransferase
MDQYLESNRELWDRLTRINAGAKSYDLDGFRKGKSSLKPLDVREVGEVRGKSLLHLQCHFGMDTLSWARLGAVVTGVDFSSEAIRLARELSAELSIPARFIESTLYDLPKVLEDRFDIVFTSYGVLCWLPDLVPWAGLIARYLKLGGLFYIAEDHPANHVFENERTTKELIVRYSYFHKDEPMKWEDDGAYADPAQKVGMPSYEWTHNLSDILNSLIRAGLVIEEFNEYPFGCYPHYPFQEKGPDGWYRFKDGRETIPLLFSLKARKPLG